MPVGQHNAKGGTGVFGGAADTPGNHGIDIAPLASQAVRFAQTPTAGDVGKVVKQTDNGTYWMLTDHTAVGTDAGWMQVGVRETSGPTNLKWGAVPDNSLVARVGTALVAATIAASLTLTAGTLALSPTATITTTGDIALGTTPSLTGNVRLPNGFTLNNRNAANTADVTQITGTGTTLALGSINVQTTITSANTTTLSLTGGGALAFNALSGQQLLFNSTAATTFGMISTAAATGFLFTFKGHDSSAVGGTGGAVLWRAGDATGASGTRTGGNFDFRPGAGASAGGEMSFQNGAGTKRIRIGDAGMAFFNVAPAAQPADMVAVTTVGVSADRVLADVGVVFNQATLNANFDDVGAAINALRTAVRQLGLMA